MGVIGLAWRNVARRPARTAMLAFSVALAIAMALALLSLSNGIETGIREGVRERGADLVVARRNAIDNFSSFLPETLEPRIAAIDGVAAVGAELVLFAAIEDDRQVLVVGWPAHSYFWRDAPIGRGRAPRDGEKAMAIGAGVAEALGKDVGDEIAIFDESLPVVGVVDYQSVVNRGLILLPLKTLQDLAFRQGQVTVFHVRLAAGMPRAKADEVGAAIGRIEDLLALPGDDLLARDRNYRILRAISLAISALALAMASLGILNALTMAVQERMRETGIVLAIGWSPARVMAAIVAEGVIVAVLGCAVGVPLGLAACAAFNRLPAIGDVIAFTPTPGLVAACVLAALALAMAGALYPARRAVSQPPAVALRRA